LIWICVYTYVQGNGRIQIFSREGVFVRYIAIAAHSFIHLCCVQGNGRIQIFSREGDFVRSIGSAGVEPGSLMEPTGVAVTPDGDVVVADYQNHRVQVRMCSLSIYIYTYIHTHTYLCIYI